MALSMDQQTRCHFTNVVEHEQIQKRTFTNWINAQLSKRSPPSRVSDLFVDLRDGAVLLDLLEVITGQPMKRQNIHGVFQQRVDLETVLDFLKEKSVKLVNINILDITDGKPTIILDLVWNIILHCHIEGMTNSLSSGLPLSPLNGAESSVSTHPPLHESFGLSAKQVLLTWAQDQCQRAGCSVSVKDFTSSWSSGEAFLATLSSLRPGLVDLTQVRTRTNLENLEQAFELAERELHIPHLLEPQDVDVLDPDEKSIMTFLAQFLQFSIKLSSPASYMQLPILTTVAFKDNTQHETPKQSLTESSKKGPTEAQKAKSQLEKSRVRVQAYIQQATKLFSNKDITEAEVKRKERALKALRPTLLEDFLSAVDRFGALCSEPQLQELTLLSDSVRKQWEDVRMEMSTYISMLRSMIKERKQQQGSALPRTNTDHAEEQQKQEEDSVRSKQGRGWTGITTNRQPKSHITSQEVIQSVKLITEATDQMESADDDPVWVSEKTPVIVSSVTLTEPTVPQDMKVCIGGKNMEVKEERWQEQEDKRVNLLKEKVDVCPQNQPHDLRFLGRVTDANFLKSEETVESGKGKFRERTWEIKHGQSLLQRRTAVLGKLMEIRTSAEELGLKEPTLPALHQRSQALMRVERSLSDLHSELEHIRKTSQSEHCDADVSQELEALWGESTKAVSERLEQCGLLAELLKRFQKIRGEVGETLQRAESTVKEQASYMGRDNLHRLHIKVDEIKAELNNLGDKVGELRSVSRQLHSHFQKVPECSRNIAFESEAHSLMDQWLDISERVELHSENLHFALSLWDDALKLGREAEHWAINKLSTFARSPSFHTEEDMEALQDEMRAQEESAKCFSRITSEIQALLQTTEPLPELQMREAQMRKKLGELKEQTEDRQTEAAKTNVTERMNASSCALHTIHQALLSLSGPHPAAVLSKLSDLYQQLQVQDEQVQVLQEDLQLLVSVGRSTSTETLCNNGYKLQERLRELHQLFSEVEEQTQRDIEHYDRLKTEVELLKQWLNNAEVTLDPSVVQKELLHQRGKTEDLSQLVLLLRNSAFQQSALIEESGKLLEQQNNYETSTSGGSRELSELLSTQSGVKAVEKPDARVSEIWGIQRGQCARSAAEDTNTCAGGRVDGLEGEIQEMQGEDDLESNQPHQSDLQMSIVPNVNNNMMEDCIPWDSQWFELETCLELLKAQLDEVSITGEAVCDDESLGRLLQDGCHRLTSLQRNMPDCQRGITATPGSAPLPQALKQLSALEKDLSQRAALRDPDTSICQQINNFLNHKRALEVSIRERMSQEQQMEGHMADTVCNDDSPILKLKQSVCAEDAVRESGRTQDKRLRLLQQSGASNQRSPGLDEFILVYKEDNTSHGQPLHSPQNEKKIEIQESFSSEEKHISTAPGKGPNWELQESITNTIVHDSKGEKDEEWTAKRVEIHTEVHASVEDSTTKSFSQDDTGFGKTEGPKVESNYCTMENPNQKDTKVSLTTDSTDHGNIKLFNDTGSLQEEKHYLDNIGILLKELCKLEFPGSCEVTDITPEQMTSDMDTEQTDRPGQCSEPGEATGGSYKHKFTMRDVLAGVQSLVENSCIINRAPRFDLSCFLKSSSDEAEIQLMRTIQRVLACRYQAAQLSPKSMMSQLQEAENLRCCIQEQVAAIQNGESDVPKSIEGLCGTALLEASATVQMKEALLDQVKKYHRQFRMTKAFLEVVVTEKEKMSLDCLGNCERQAEQLGALLKTIDHKRCLIDECAKLSGQLSVHLTHTERFGVLVAHLGDIQEDWRILELSIKTKQQQASNSAFQICAFRREVKQLKDRLEDLLISLQSFVTLPDFQSTMHLLTWTADVKMYSQQHANLRSLFDSIVHFSIGQNDKGDLKNDLDKLESLLNESKMKLRVFTGNCGSIYSTDVNSQLQDFFIWTKQAESHIVTAEKLSLFPEEARIQISEMERFQADLSYRRGQIEEIQSEERKTTSKEDCEQMLHELLELHQTISNSLCQCLRTMKDNLKDRENLFAHLAILDEWLAEIHIKTDFDPDHVENALPDDIPSLEKQCDIHKENTLEIESKLKMADAVAESCDKILVGLNPGESRYLVNRLAGVRTEIGGLLAHEKAVVLELEELIHWWYKCNEDLSNVETDLEQICLTLKKKRFPLTQESISEIVLLKYKLAQHQYQVQGLQGYQEVKRSSVLDAIGELLDRYNALGQCTIEQDKYMQLRERMELSREIVYDRVRGAKEKETSLGERFRLCQYLLVELPLVKTQCQEVADQLEAIAQDLYPTELNAERQRIRQTVETLVMLEHAVTEDIRNLESKLMLGLRFETDLPASVELMRRTKQELEEAKPVDPDEKAVDVRLQRYWVLWRNMESGMRVLEGLARKQKKNLRHHEELYATRNAAMKECLVQMESLSQARESLKDYQWAAQGATGFLRNAEATFLSSCRGFVDCTEEQRQTGQALDALEAGFQAHVDHLTKVTPRQLCLSRTKMEKVHIELLSQLLVGRAVLEAQAQLRLEALQRCSEGQQKHTSHHEGVLRTMCKIEDSLSKCAAERINSFEQCTAQHKMAKLLREDLQVLFGQIEELGVECPTQGCGAGRGREVGAPWRRWAALRRTVGLLTAHTERKAEEWKDISTSIEQCCTTLASLQTELPPCSPGGVSEEGSMTLLARAELHQAGLETQQRALASLEHRLEHALSRAHSHSPSSPGPLGKTLVKIKEGVRSLKERNRQVVEAAQEKEMEKRCIVEELAELESHVLCLSSTLERCSGQPQQQESKQELSSLQTKLQHTVDRLHSCYSEIPLDICTHLQDIQHSLQRAEERMTERSAHVEMLARRVEELRSGLERVKELLKQRSPSVAEAQHALKHVWDELDMWHGRLMLLESEVQDLAEDLPDQAHLLMDQLTEPLQWYQSTAQRMEQHTAFVSKIPACLRQFADILYRATCWLDEAQSWLSASCSFTTAKSLQNHANSLQLLLEDSERIRCLLQDFRPVLCDISAVCDIGLQESKLEETDRYVLTMQQTILQPLGSLLQTATVVEDLETELKTIERNVSKMEAILSAEDNGSISVTEHLHNRQVIVSSAQSAKDTLQDMQRVKEELDLSTDTKDKLLVFCKASSLLQRIDELEQLPHKKATVLEDNTREKEGCSTSKNQADRKQQEAFVVSSPEEDEDDAMSSSDTLTSSVAEDPDETIRAADLRRTDGDKQLANVQVIDGLPCERDSLDTTESWLLSVRPWLDTSVSENMDSDVEPGDLQNTEMTKQLISTDVSMVENQTSVVMDESQRQEANVSSSPRTKSGLEDTRLVPVRPITPFAVAAALEEEEDERPSLSARPTELLETSNEIIKWNDKVEEEKKYEETNDSPEKMGLCFQKENAIEQPRWTQMSEQICQKLSSVDKLQHDFQISNGETLSIGAVLQQTQQAVLALRTKMSSSVSEEQSDLLDALKRVSLCLDALTSFQSGNSNPELKQLQSECLRGELATLSELLNHIELGENMAFSRCVTSLRQRVSAVGEQLRSHMGLTQLQQVTSDHMFFVDCLELKQNSLFQGSEEVPVMQRVLVRHLRHSPGAGAGLRQASQSLLQGMSGLVELGEECTTEGQTRTLRSQSELQLALRRLEKLQEVLASQSAFAHYVFQRETLKCHEDEWAQLQIRDGALQQQALDQQVSSHRNLQEWTQWEDNCGQLGWLLSESEAFLSAEEQTGAEAEELRVQQRIQGCQHILSKLDESRAALGLLLDQGENLQVTLVRQKGGALELQWKNVHRQAEENFKHCQDTQENEASFQTDLASISQWLTSAKQQVQNYSDLAATSDLKLERVSDSLMELLDLCAEVGVRSVQKELLCRNACLCLRVQISSLESQWSQLTSALSKTQERLQQHLLKSWPPNDLSSALEDWLKKKQAHCNKEKEEAVKATSATCLSEYLQRLKGLQTGLQYGQLLLDFLCQSEPPLVGEDTITHCSERTMLAERLGALRLCWVGLRGELEIQMNEGEHMHHIWTRRQKKLMHLQNLIDRMRKKLDQWKRPHSEILARRLLLEWEGHLESLKDIAANVEELKGADSNAGNEMQKYTGDAVFAEEVEVLSQACEDFIHEAETVKPSLLQTVEKWSCFKRLLNEISLHSVRLHCSLQQLQAAPSFSLQQEERHLHNLQELHSTANISGGIWDTLDESYKNLVKNIDSAAAHVLNDQMEREQKRWKAVLQDLADRMRKTQESISAWQEFTDQTKCCSLQLQNLWSQWEELEQLPLPYEDAEARLEAAEDLQEKVESVKSNLEHLVEASKLLTEQQDPMASNVVLSQTSQLSYDAMILSQTLQMHKRRIQDDNELLKDFKVNLEKLEHKTKDIEAQMNGVSDVNAAKQVFWELASLFSSVFDVSEMSAHVNLSNREVQTLHVLKGRYMESLARGLHLYKQLHFQHHISLDFEGKCKALKDIQDTLEQEATSANPQSYADFKQMAAVHQKLLGDIATGHKLLHGLQCDAVMVMENVSPEQRSETLACVSRLRQKWIDLLNVIDQSRSLVKQQLSQFTTYQSGVKHLNNVFKDIDVLLPPTGPTICVSPLKIRDYEDSEKALQAHSAIYTRTVDVGRTLCDSMTDAESQTQLKTEVHALEAAWERATSQLQRQKASINTTVQKWGQCQQKIKELRSELDECGLQLKQAVPATAKDAEEVIQETEFSLQHLRTGGLNGVDTMKMDLSPYVPAGDSALLEKQLEQLHTQWEDLCMKVSLRKQEIADRLNAWTIFNDKNKEFCDWMTQMENKVCHSADLSFEEMVEKLKKDCMEEINLFSENKRHLKQLGEQLLWASDEAKQSQVHGSLQEANQRWHCLFHHIEARVKKLKETLAAVQQLDKNMSNLRSWLSRIEAELSRPITYSVLHHQEIQKRLAEHQELQRDIEQHTEGVASVLNLCDVLLQDEDASNGTGADGDSLQETSRSLDHRWRTICAMALDRRLRIEETWRLWCKFLDDYSRFEDWLKMAERTAANPNTGDVPYTVAKEELKKFEGFQRQVNERLTQLEIVNNQYRRLARENRTDRASQLKAMVHEGNRRWDTLHRRVGTILRRLKYFTSQREDFESTRESMLVWLTELDLQLTNVEHFSESDVHHKIQQLNSFQKEITLNTERIDGLIVFGEGLIQRSSPQDAALIEEELEELHSYCQEVFGRLVRFHHRLSQPPIPAEPESPITSFSLESSLELIGRPWLGRSLSNPLATPTHLLVTPLPRSGRDTPVSVDSLPLEWDHTGDVGGSSSHEDEDEEDLDDEGAYFSAVSSRSVCDSPRWRTQEELVELESDGYAEALPTLASTPLKQGNYLHLMSQCSDSIEDFKRVSLILDDEEPDEFGLTGINLSGRQSGVIERWELAQAQSQTDLRDDPREQLPWTLDQISSWLHTVIPQLQTVLQSDPPSTVEDMSARAKELKEMHKMFAQHKSTMLQLNLNRHEDPDLQQKLASVNQSWSKACTDLQHWDTTLRKTLLRCREFHETLHSLLLWLAHAESRRYAVDIHRPEITLKALKQHRNTLTDVREELVRRQTQQASLHALWSQLQPEHSEDSDEAQEKLHVIGSKMRILLREVTEDLMAIQQRLEKEPTSDEQDKRVSAVPSEGVLQSMKKSSNSREGRDPARPRSFFLRLLRAAFPLHLLLLLLLLLPCLVPMSPPEQSCTVANNFARSFYPMLRYTNGPPPT